MAERNIEKSQRMRPAWTDGAAVPLDETEAVLAEIWRDFLGVEHIGLTDNFYELGGDSLLAAQILSRVRKTFHIEIPLSALLDEPTLAALSARIQAIRRAADELKSMPAGHGNAEEEEGEI